MSEFRIVAQWRTTRTVFLVVMASDASECRELLQRALSEYTLEDIKALDSMWYERWYDRVGYGEWVPFAEIRLGNIRNMKRFEKNVLLYN